MPPGAGAKQSQRYFPKPPHDQLVQNPVMQCSKAITVANYTRVDGRWMHARVSLDRAPAGAPVVVLVHGIGVSSRYMVPLAAQLANHFRVFAVDLPGYGRSDDPGRVLRLPELADALSLWLESMHLGPVALLGNSFGCQIVVELAVRDPQRVSAVVLQGPTIDPSARSIPRQLLRSLRSGRESPSLGLVTARDYAACGLGRVAETFRIAVRDPVEHKLPHVRAPALVVRGSRDAVVSEQWAEQVAHLLPHGRLAVVPGAAHAMNYTNPLELARVVRPFLLRV